MRWMRYCKMLSRLPGYYAGHYDPNLHETKCLKELIEEEARRNAGDQLIVERMVAHDDLTKAQVIQAAKLMAEEAKCTMDGSYRMTHLVDRFVDCADRTCADNRADEKRREERR